MDPNDQLESSIARFSDAVAAQVRAARVVMQARLPGSIELVYDNYNALAIAYSASDRASDIVFSVAAYPRWVSLFLMGGPGLNDPEGLLKGTGGTMRHIVLGDQHRLEDATVRDLMDQAIALAGHPFDASAPSRTIIKSISAKQRPRRP
jgi:hypothetical protein